MSKVDNLLSVMKEHVAEWCCATCASNSGQPAATFREAKKRGYKFEEVSPNRWGKEILCPVCGVMRTHYKLLSIEPEFAESKRYGITLAARKKIIELFQNRDAITGASISSVAEIDHKTPWTRREQDIDASKASDEEIFQYFQLLTREHNLLKDRMCAKCKKTNIRPPFLEIEYWNAGNENYVGTCEGCGWYDAKKWRQAVAAILKEEGSKPF